MFAVETAECYLPKTPVLVLDRLTLYRGREERVFYCRMENSYRVEKPDAHQPFLPCLPRAKTGHTFS